MTSSQPRQGAAAPTVARLADFANHGHCPTASLAFAEGYDLDRVLQGTAYADPFGQSEFMFERGRMFERLVKQDAGDGHCRYGPLLELLREHLGFDTPDARIVNLRQELGTDMEARARRTRRLLREMAEGREGFANIVDGAVLQATVAGHVANYEADGLAFRLGGRLRVVEVKSFPVVDGQADPVALAAALDQGALYIHLVRMALDAESLDPDLVSDKLVLVTPRNVGLTPTLHERGVGARIARIRLLLDKVPNEAPATGAEGAPVRFAEVAPRQGRRAEERIDAAFSICEDVGNEFGAACQGCGMYRLCRDRAFGIGAPELAGDSVARELAGVADLDRAAKLADGALPTPMEAPAARALSRAADLHAEALVRSLP
jgi:hypothetical protein